MTIAGGYTGAVLRVDLTEGIVRKILTNSATHPHGIKVCLESGVVGRVKAIIPE